MSLQCLAVIILEEDGDVKQMNTIIVKDNYLPAKTFNLLYNKYQECQQKNEIIREFFYEDPTPDIANFINYFDKKRGYRKLGKFIHTAATPPNFDHPKHYEAEFKIPP